MEKSDKAATKASKPRSPRRGNTHRKLLDAALKIASDKGSFSSVSLRHVTRKAGVVPTAFYRHFKDMDEVGLVLIDESFRTLRQMMKEIRKQQVPTEKIIQSSVKNYFDYVRKHHEHFLFVTKVRHTGNPILRTAVQQEIKLFTSELATDLARLLPSDRISADDLQVIAALIVNTLASTSQQMTRLDDKPNAKAEQKELVETTAKQLRIISLGVAAWQSDA